MLPGKGPPHNTIKRASVAHNVQANLFTPNSFFGARHASPFALSASAVFLADGGPREAGQAVLLSAFHILPKEI
jgi:hypothetical protein